MQPRFHRYFIFMTIMLGGLRLDCALNLPSRGTIQTWYQNQPLAEVAMRAVDTVLFEPGYRHARELTNTWRAYADAFVQDEKRATDLEMLVNSPAITAFLKDPDSSLAPAFAIEAARLLDEYNNHTFKAWRLRTLAGKIVLQRNAAGLATLDISETRREVTARYVTVPISNAGYNYSLDAEWDISRLHDFPLTQASSEFLFVQTDAENNLLALPEGTQLPNAIYKFVSGEKFIAPSYGVHAGMRVLSVESSHLRLYVCYPFAGYLFYTVRGLVFALMLFGLVFAISKIKNARSVAAHVLENRSGRWLEQHYNESLTLNERALDLSEKATGLVAEIKERDASVIAELGGHIQHLTRAIRTESERALVGTVNQPGKSTAAAPNVQRPLHRKPVYREPTIIEADHKPSIEVSVELDLPISDEKELSKDQKVAYVASLKNRAKAKSAQKDFVHDEALDQFDYVPAEPMELPAAKVKPIKDAPDEADLEYVQKFRYTGKTRVLPMAETVRKTEAFHLREDLHTSNLVIGEEE